MGPVEYEFARISAVRFLPDDRIAIADAGNHNIRIFSFDGEHLRTLGRAGGGPGEYALPTTIAVDTALHVIDPVNTRETVYDLHQYRLIVSRTLPPAGGHQVVQLAQLPDGSRVLSTSPPVTFRGVEEPLPDVLILRYDGPQEPDTLMKFPPGGAIWYTIGELVPWGGAPSPFGPGGAWAARDSALALVDGIDGLVRLYTMRVDGELAETGAFPLPGPRARPVTDRDLDDVADSVRALFARNGRQLGRIGIVGPDYWSTARAALFDAAGALWVFRQEAPDGGHLWTRVGPDGRTDSWLLPRGFRLADVQLPWLAGIVADNDGVQTVRLLRVRIPR